MRIEPLSISGVHLMTPESVKDERGSFTRLFDRELFGALGLETIFPQWSMSRNRRAGTLRGLHFQTAPHVEIKLVQCVRGAIFDVVVDLRLGSPSYGRHISLELSADNQRMLYVPAGFAHGFQTLCDESDVIYHISAPFVPDASRGLLWNDPDVSIEWPDVSVRVISDRDRSLPTLLDLSHPS